MATAIKVTKVLQLHKSSPYSFCLKQITRKNFKWGKYHSFEKCLILNIPRVILVQKFGRLKNLEKVILENFLSKIQSNREKPNTELKHIIYSTKIQFKFLILCNLFINNFRYNRYSVICPKIWNKIHE